jgi:hypothetical protein
MATVILLTAALAEGVLQQSRKDLKLTLLLTVSDLRLVFFSSGLWRHSAAKLPIAVMPAAAAGRYCLH